MAHFLKPLQDYVHTHFLVSLSPKILTLLAKLTLVPRSSPNLWDFMPKIFLLYLAFDPCWSTKTFLYFLKFHPCQPVGSLALRSLYSSSTRWDFLECLVSNWPQLVEIYLGYDCINILLLKLKMIFSLRYTKSLYGFAY